MNAEKPLKNKKHEEFCHLYSGEFWGEPAEAYYAAGYKSQKHENARAYAKKLLKKEDIFHRIKYLREIKMNELGADKVWIAQMRKFIAENAEKENIRLSALKDLERSLGLLDAEKE